jgi:hypothetical protein
MPKPLYVGHMIPFQTAEEQNRVSEQYMLTAKWSLQTEA